MRVPGIEQWHCQFPEYSYRQVVRNIETVQNKRPHQILYAVFLLGAFYWFGLRTDPKVDMLNEALHQAGSRELQGYPYLFKVIRLEGVDGEIAVMGTPRSSEVPVFRMIGVINPNLSGKSPMHPDFVAAEKELAKVQSEARQIVLSQHGVSSVKWELDKNWLIAHNIQIN